MNPCPDCTFENETGSAFCIQCGHDFTAAPKSIPADVKAADQDSEDQCDSEAKLKETGPVDSATSDAVSSQGGARKETAVGEGETDDPAADRGETKDDQSDDDQTKIETDDPATDHAETDADDSAADQGENKDDESDEDDALGEGNLATSDDPAQDAMDSSPVEDSEDDLQEALQNAEDEIGDHTAGAGGQAHIAVSEADEDTGAEHEAGGTTEDKVGNAEDKVGNASSEIKDRARDVRSRTKENTTSDDQVRDTMIVVQEASMPSSEPLENEERTAESMNEASVEVNSDTTTGHDEFTTSSTHLSTDSESIQSDPPVDILARLPQPGVNSPISPLQFDDAGEGAYGERWWLKPATESDEGPSTQAVHMNDELGDQQADRTAPNDALPAHIPGRAAVEFNRQRFDDVPSVVDDTGSKNRYLVIVALIVIAVTIFMVAR